jgi:hypothetical protein
MAGIVGVAFNVPFHGTGYINTAPLLETGRSRTVSADQVEQDQLLAAAADRKVDGSPGDRSLRPACSRAWVDAAGLQALLAIGRGAMPMEVVGDMYSRQPHPYEDAGRSLPRWSIFA